jgi:curli biogenesis system outer membrane secretion channel CsgG
MSIRTLVAALALALAGLVSVPTSSTAAPADASVQLTHPCTRTSSHTCIRGGQFCPQASYGHSGWDARGRRYVCKGDHQHPHWMIP